MYHLKRHQLVRIIGDISPQWEITCGVPQGSTPGTLLFLIYINDTHHAVCKSTIYHFADDTNLLYLCKTLKELHKIMNNDLKTIIRLAMCKPIIFNYCKNRIYYF